MGPAPKQPAIKEPLLVGYSARGQRSGGPRAESEIRGESQPSPWGPPAHPALGQAGSCVLQGSRALTKATQLARPRPWGGSDSLPHPRLCNIMAAAVCIGCSVCDLAPAVRVTWGTWGPVGSWVPGSLSVDSWTSEGECCALGPGVFLLKQRITFLWRNIQEHR